MKSKIKAQHTPTPWKLATHDGCIIIGPNEEHILETSNLKNAAFIVRAVNSHEELLREANKAMVEISLDWQRCDLETGEECNGLSCHVGAHRAIKILEIAIAKAEEKI